MKHTIEAALSGRAKCRGCARKIEKDELRLGERLPNPYAEDADMTVWFHVDCGAFKRPEVLLEALQESEAEVKDSKRLREVAQESVEHRRLPRADGVERSPTGRARCRSCSEMIAKDSWRIRLAFYEEGRFNPGGFVHLGCCQEYFGTTHILDRLLHFSDPLDPDEIAEIRSGLAD
ncbi:MAG TPA: hypothetical protein VLU25_06510 [Acidobacteriota bacterium]|nr:hypothetical protein [Acidobacteriota bacterium]